MQAGIDWLGKRADVILGWGWIFVSPPASPQVSLAVCLSDDTVVEFPVTWTAGFSRTDSTSTHPPRAIRREFVVLGTVPEGLNVGETMLRLAGMNGQQWQQTVRCHDLARPTPFPFGGGASIYKKYFNKALTLTRSGDFRDLLTKIRGWRSRHRHLELADPVQAVADFCRQHAISHLVLIVDHSLGGGAYAYREQLITDYLKTGQAVAVLTFRLSSLQHVLALHRSVEPQRQFALKGLSAVAQLARASLLSEVFFNNAVAFPHPGEIPLLLARLHEIHGLPVNIALHDFFPICPSQWLLAESGVYCEIPAIEICQRCLRRNPFVVARDSTTYDLEEWRRRWSLALAAAQRVLCFSRSSVELLRRVFPELETAKLELRPHTIGAMAPGRLTPDFARGLNIGVVGTINYHKGAEVVAGLARCIRERNLDARISVIGTLDAEYDRTVVSVTGAFPRKALPRLIQQSGANLMFFPSIWPETFSYVTEELMHLGLPVICFDLGAPAERIASYHLGRVIPLEDDAITLERILNFYHELRQAEAPPRCFPKS